MSEPTNKSDSKLPNVAVIMAAYNVEKYVENAINSALEDHYKNKRIYVYNDGSTDNTEKVLEDSWADFCYHNFENRGLSFGRNLLIHKAWDWADYFMILDADDQFIGTDKITKMVNVALSAPNLIGAVYCDYQNWNEKTGVITREYKRAFSREELCKECILSDSGTLVSKIAYQTVGLYDETLKVGMDYDLWLRISERFLIYHIPECLTQVTIRENSLSSSPENKEIWQKNIGRVYQKLHERTNS